MKYRTICADPPWPYPGGFKTTLPTGRSKNVKRDGPRAIVSPLIRRELPYVAMSVAEIASLPVSSLADPSGCRLFLWTTNTYLPSAFEILQRWGFTYGQTLVWHKLNPTPWPTSVAPNSAEFILVGTIGAPERLGVLPSAVIAHGVPKEHSRKPEIFLDWIEQVSPSPRVELFSRRHRLGWSVMGDAFDDRPIAEVLNEHASSAQ